MPMDHGRHVCGKVWPGEGKGSWRMLMTNWTSANFKPFCHACLGLPLEFAAHSTKWRNSFKVMCDAGLDLFKSGYF